MIKDFLQSCPENYDFPTGGTVKIPTEAESKLVALTGGEAAITEAVADHLRDTINRKDAYSLVIFAVRMAVLSARLNDAEPLKASLWTTCIDDNEVDWRDVLVALSIIEDCATRIRCDFVGLLTQLAANSPSRRKKTVCDGYLSRTPEMRDVETMGYKGVESQGGGLNYVRCY